MRDIGTFAKGVLAAAWVLAVGLVIGLVAMVVIEGPAALPTPLAVTVYVVLGLIATRLAVRFWRSI